MNLVEILKKYKIEYRENEEMKSYTTLHIGGKADLIVFPQSIFEISQILNYVQPIVLGNGSNVLVSDDGIRGVVMCLKKFHRIKVNQDQLICEAGGSLKKACNVAQAHELSGLEFAYGIPGSVGGAVYMNAGAYGGEMSDVVSEVLVLKNGEIVKYKQNEMDFKYRSSCFMNEKVIILSVTFQLKKGDSQLIQSKMNELWEKRVAKQPLEHYSAGSTFKRGKDFYASALISECGLKGYRVNDASVSKKHAGFLINEGQASAKDFLQLMAQVKQIVYQKTQKTLEEEIRFLE